MVDPELYPFNSHFHDRQGLRYHYLDEGQGDSVVMVHGNPTWSFYYRNLVIALRDRYRVVVPDHIGCGYSDKPSVEDYPYTLKNRVDDLEGLLDHLDIKQRITLVVHDWGGMIGMAYATRYPERIARLVVLNTSAFPLPHDKRFPLALWLGRNTWLGAFLIRRFNAFCRVANRVCVKRKPLSPALAQAYLTPYDSPENRIAVLRFVQDIPLRPTDPSYGIVAGVAEALEAFSNTPLLICWGLRDFVFSTHFLVEWERRLPHGEVHRFEDCGHYILEDAKDEVIQRVEDFFARHPIA